MSHKGGIKMGKLQMAQFNIPIYELYFKSFYFTNVNFLAGVHMLMSCDG